MAGLAALIRAQPGWHVVGSAASCREAIDDAGVSRADIVILEPAVGAMDGLARLREFAVRTRVLCISTLAEDLLAERVLREGARGFLMKSSRPEEIVAGIRQVFAGDIVLSPGARLRIIERIAGTEHTDEPPLGLLNNRELQLVHLIGVNRSLRQIAAHMGLSEKTVATHRLRIREKLSLRNASELVRVAARWAGQDMLS